MKPEEITALAREYAEWVLSVPGAEELPNCLRNQADGTLREDAEEVLTWLTGRFALVEKETVLKLLEEHRKENRGADNGSREWFYYNGRLELLKSLFPDITKEVKV